MALDVSGGRVDAWAEHAKKARFRCPLERHFILRVRTSLARSAPTGGGDFRPVDRTVIALSAGSGSLLRLTRRRPRARNGSMHAMSPAWGNGALTKIFDDVYFVVGTNKVHHAGVELQTSRTMLVVRDAGQLTLINSVRLDDRELRALEALGKVEHVIRLGAFHGRDDPFYRERYGATLWALPGSAHADGREADRQLDETAQLPLSGARAFAFRSAKYPEAALLLAREGGILVTCDAIQNWTCVDGFFSAETGALFTAQGLIRPANVPSTWLAACEPARDDFERLLAMAFRHLISAHGEPLIEQAHARIQARVQEVFASR